jgi:hypothetical protein
MCNRKLNYVPRLNPVYRYQRFHSSRKAMVLSRAGSAVRPTIEYYARNMTQYTGALSHRQRRFRFELCRYLWV